MPTGSFLNNIAHIESLGCIELTGQDSVKFLQGQITIDAESITTGKLNQGAICNPQGRCMALFWATEHNGSIYLIQMRDTIESTIKHLSKYAVFFKTQLTDRTEGFRFYGIGDSIWEQLENSNYPATLLSDNNSPNIKLAMVLPADVDKFESNFSHFHDQQLWLFKIATKKVPWLNAVSQSEFLPHNLNLPELAAVDFKKGCFTGQEVIARMQYKGKLKSHLQLLTTETTSEAVTPLMKIWSKDKKAGEVICASQNSTGEYAVLVLLKDNYLESKNFRLNTENGPILKLTNTTDQE